MPGPAHFTIRAASALTGINQNTLRAWERRHGLLSPARTPKGYRLFTHDDIERLRMIQALLARGIPVSQVRAHLDGHDGRGTTPPHSNGANGAKVNGSATPAFQGIPTHGAAAHAEPRSGLGSAPAAQAGTGPRDGSLEDFAFQVEDAARRHDRPRLERAFSRAIGIHGLRPAFAGVLVPALEQRAGTGAAAESRFLETFARERLVSALAGLRPLHQQPRVLCAHVSGERSSGGLMLLALEAGMLGLCTHYLGCGATLDEVGAAAEPPCRVVVLAIDEALPREALLRLKVRLDARARAPRLMLAGSTARSEREWIEAHGMAVLPPDTEAAGHLIVEAARIR